MGCKLVPRPSQELFFGGIELRKCGRTGHPGVFKEGVKAAEGGAAGPPLKQPDHALFLFRKGGSRRKRGRRKN
jgi:hypothetical protein